MCILAFFTKFVNPTVGFATQLLNLLVDLPVYPAAMTANGHGLVFKAELKVSSDTTVIWKVLS